MTRKALVTLLLLAAGTGCATPKPPPWLPAEGRYRAPKAGFELEGPPGWMRRNVAEGVESFQATRDGTGLQRIVAGSTEVGKPIGFGYSKRPLAAGLSPSELTELVLDGFRAAEDVADVALLESSPERLAGREGFRAQVRWRKGALARRALVVGVMEGPRLFWLAYVAPERHYFELDRPTFERVVQSFRLLAPAGAPGRA